MVSVHLLMMVLLFPSLCLRFHSPSPSITGVQGMHMRENSNVLVPNNDVNLMEKIKKAVDNDDIEELKGFEVENIKREVRNPKLEKIEKLLKNQNSDDNQIIDELGTNQNLTNLTVNVTKNANFEYETNSLLDLTEDLSDSLALKPTKVIEKFGVNNCIIRDQLDVQPKWIDDDGRLVKDFIIESESGNVKMFDLSRMFKTKIEYEKYLKDTQNKIQLKQLRYLSMAFNDFIELPVEVLVLSRDTLSALSLTGNNFERLACERCLGSSVLNLKQLDIRLCRLKSITKGLFDGLKHLEYLDVSNNFIKEIHADSLPLSLLHIDLSFNFDSNSSIPDTMEFRSNEIFKRIEGLQSIDFSSTKFNDKGFEVLKHLPNSLRHISLCYVELPDFKGSLLGNCSNIEMLDISGNSRLNNLSSEKFANFRNSLQVLYIRDSNIRNLTWTKDLRHLKSIDLSDNNIHTITLDSFSHMENLIKLDLEKNSIGNWYDKIFSNNQKLDILNLRENKLTKLTNDMKADLSVVKFLALGNNEFECTCAVQQFIQKLFQLTKAANITAIKEFSKSVEFEEDEEEISTTKPTRISFASRTVMDPKYDIISRTYKKYYEKAARSIEALKIRTNFSDVENYMKKSLNMLMMRSKAKMSDDDDDSSLTLLFDYNEDDDDYKCIDAIVKKKKPIITLDACKTENVGANDDFPSGYRSSSLFVMSFAMPSVMIICILGVVTYWKWWHIRYFFVLCKNSAVLTFMDDAAEQSSIAPRRCDQTNGVDSFVYDVFVSYSEQNRDWVLEEFITNVEKRESISVCLHERDFQVGFGILENIISCMDRSRCLLLLISEDFLMSNWCQFEMNLAQHRLLEARREKLILVLLENIPEKKQPRTLKYLMRTKTYIKWPQNGGGNDEKKLFWKRLKKAIISSKWETENYGSVR